MLAEIISLMGNFFPSALKEYERVDGGMWPYARGSRAVSLYFLFVYSQGDIIEELLLPSV